MSSMGRTDDAGSGTTDRNHNVDSTDEADNSESQLNLALEKSISGCWAMNLQTHKSHHSKMKSGFDFFFVLLNYVSECENFQTFTKEFHHHTTYHKGILTFLGQREQLRTADIH